MTGARTAFDRSLPVVPSSLQDLEFGIDQRESSVADLRPDNEARIVWCDRERPRRTPTAVVYLHGLTASQGDGAPSHLAVARGLGANAFLARLPGHGRQAPDAARGLSAAALEDAAGEALAIGRAIGERVVLIGTSIGASLAVGLAASHPVAALALWSPGVRPAQPAELERVVRARDVVEADPTRMPPAAQPYWASSTHVDAFHTLAAVFADVMRPSTYARIRVPVFGACYFADVRNQDGVASVPAMREMFEQFATPAPEKVLCEYPDGTHAIACAARSPASGRVAADTLAFLRRVIPD